MTAIDRFITVETPEGKSVTVTDFRHPANAHHASDLFQGKPVSYGWFVSNSSTKPHLGAPVFAQAFLVTPGDPQAMFSWEQRDTWYVPECSYSTSRPHGFYTAAQAVLVALDSAKRMQDQADFIIERCQAALGA